MQATFTMDTYSHIMEGMQTDAADLLKDVVPACISKRCREKKSRKFSGSGVNASVAQG